MSPEHITEKLSTNVAKLNTLQQLLDAICKDSDIVIGEYERTNPYIDIVHKVHINQYPNVMKEVKASLALEIQAIKETIKNLSNEL